MKQIKIPIPEKKDVERWKDIVWFKLNGGFSCTKCGAKSNFNHALFESWVGSKRLMLENRTPGICAECTQKEMNEKADIVFTEQNCKCDWCGEHTATTSFPRHKDLESEILIGGVWWNGHHICQCCLNVGFDNHGPIYSNVRGVNDDDEPVMRNELGLWIKT